MRQRLNAGEWCEIDGDRVDVYDGDGNLTRSAEKPGLGIASQAACDAYARVQQWEQQRIDALTAPIVAPTIQGSTVNEIIESATQAVTELTEQLNARLQILAEVSNA